ncbi:MAG: CDP-diacylglycerol--serine O-phosphatidyltransferase [Balneolaceae bacterium]
MKYPIQKLQELKLRRRRRKHKRKRKRKPIPRLVVPSFFTLMNLFCGFLSILTVAEGNLVFGAWLIVFAGLFDSLDGVVARLTNATSPFGSELDSLSDVVSFGVAPGFLIYSFALHELAILGVILSSLPPLCGAVRLARFNIDAKDLSFEDFRGLPIPSQAVMLVAFVLTFLNRGDLFSQLQFGVSTVLVPIIVLLSFLMLSTIPFDKLPRFNKLTFKYKKAKFMQFLVYLSMIIVFQEYGLMIVFSVYIIKGLLIGGWLFWNEQFGDEDVMPPEDLPLRQNRES